CRMACTFWSVLIFFRAMSDVGPAGAADAADLRGAEGGASVGRLHQRLQRGGVRAVPPHDADELLGIVRAEPPLRAARGLDEQGRPVARELGHVVQLVVYERADGGRVVVLQAVLDV